MPFDILPSAIAAGSALLGIAVGGHFSAHNQKRERQQRRISEQLAEFYSPLVAMRAVVLAKSELRLKISGAADVACLAMMEHAYKRGVEHVMEIDKERSPLFEKIIEYDNRELAEEIMPTYRKMVELFGSKIHFAEPSSVLNISLCS
jgi:hypothetical protein